MKIKIKKAINGQFYWILVAANGETLATSETYVAKQSCKDTADKVSQDMYLTRTPVTDET
jgi:uncharacterized protein YegP (UPF0339 family)